MIAQIGPLQAEEALMRSTEAAIGSGSLKREERQRIISSWQRQARSGGKKRPPVSKELRRIMLAAQGIKLTELPRKKKENG